MNNKNRLVLVVIILLLGIVLITIGITQTFSNKDSDKEKESSEVDISNNKDDQNIKENDNNPPSDNTNVYANINGIEIVDLDINKETILKVSFHALNNTDNIINNKIIVLELLNENTIIETIEFEIVELEPNDKMEFGFTNGNEELLNKDIKYQFKIKD